ncbi:hypothetical protein LB577_03095 [Mesorhizobium sp. B283B1A]|uniref:hypothetical protein n=1 Tax=Mesorhizobium TaxID=68287 RepID=UPI001CD10B28|nr:MULTISPECIES: hypothetical protein [Mesorhizobium]MCA0045948.1 hypothetical protein [Mesorhizobium sp. B283B1A]UQS64685.1 hypothetical protein M5D98_32395 [Mesorhizobium opportunistum]
MKSDFSAARVHLDRAYHYLGGDDPMSQTGREALDAIIEAVAFEEFKQPRRQAEVIPFPDVRRF